MTAYASFGSKENEQYAAEFDYWFKIGKRDRLITRRLHEAGKPGGGFQCFDENGVKLVGAAKTGYRAGWKDVEWQLAS